MQSGKSGQEMPSSSCTEHHKRNIRSEDAYAKSRKKATADAKQACKVGIEEYIWRTANDARVCGRCAANEGKRYRYNSPPTEGLPGYADGCRCWAESVIDVSKLKEPKQGKVRKVRKTKKQYGCCMLPLLSLVFLLLLFWVVVL